MVLSEMMDVQRRFTAMVLEGRGTDLGTMTEAQVVEFTREVVLALHAEADELLEEINWRMHRAHVGKVVRSNIVYECVDVFKFLLNVLLVWGVTPEQFAEAFSAKSRAVESRYVQERTLADLREQGREIVAFDVDGVLAEYPGHWLSWLAARGHADPASGVPYRPFDSVNAAKDSMSPDVYADLKMEYRSSGAKRNIPPCFGSADAVARIRAAGFGTVALSARPAWKISRLHADTLDWFAEYGMTFDAVYFDADKSVKAARSLPNLRAIVEDDVGQAREVARLGVDVYLVGKHYIGDWSRSAKMHVVPVADVCEAVDLIIGVNKTIMRNG